MCVVVCPLLTAGWLASCQDDADDPMLSTVAAFLEFHAPYGGFIHPKLADVAGGKWDTLLKNGAVYNNFVRMDISA